jgi:hypothetical protein
MANVPEEAIWIEDAAKQYGVTRQWLKQQIDNGLLSYVDVKGDRRIYLVASEVAEFMKPQIKRVTPTDSEADQDRTA